MGRGQASFEFSPNTELISLMFLKCLQVLCWSALMPEKTTAKQDKLASGS